MSATSRAIRIAAAVTATFVVLWQHRAVVETAGLHFDEAYNLQVPLNLHLNGRYQTWYGAPHPFDYRITTGPTVLVPVAASFALFGPSREAARGVMSLYLLAFLFAVWVCCRRAAPGRSAELYVLVLLLFLCVPDFSAATAAVLGEIPGLSFALAAIVVQGRAQGRRSVAVAGFAGFLLGLALLTKLIFVLLVPAFLAASIWSRLDGIRSAVAIGLGCFVPLLLWHSVQIATLGEAAYFDRLGDVWEHVRFAGSGINLDAYKLADRGPWAHLVALAGALSLPPVTISIGICAALGCSALFARRAAVDEPAAGSFVLRSLASMAILHCGWWFSLGSWLSYRHLLPGYLLYVFAMAIVLIRSLFRSGGVDLATLGAAVLALSLTVPVLNPSGGAGGSGRLHPPDWKLQLEMAEIVRRHAVDPDAVFYGFAWDQAPEISFLTQIPFRDVTREAPDAQRSNYLVQGSWRSASLQIYAAHHCAPWLVDGFAPFSLCRLRANAPRGEERNPLP